MPTHRGVLLAAASVLGAVLGRLLGLTELFILAAGGATLLVASVVYVRTNRLVVVATRRVNGHRVHLGTPSRMELSLINMSRRRSPSFEAIDPITGQQAKHLVVPPLEPGSRVRSVHLLPTDRRGVYVVGPMRVVLRDPFGLASTQTTVASEAHLIVCPRVEPMAPLPAALGGSDPSFRTEQSSFVGQQSEDLSTLRRYEEGDDLRRVHWRSTARLGELMVRQDETPWDARTTVLVDVRRSHHSAPSLETALSAAGSIAAAARTDRSMVRMIGTDGADSGFGSGSGHTLRMLEQLARVRSTSSASLVSTLNRVCRGTAGGTLVVIATSALGDMDVRRIAALRTRFPRLVLVVVEVSGRAHSPRPGYLGVTTVRVPENGSLARSLSATARRGHARLSGSPA